MELYDRLVSAISEKRATFVTGAGFSAALKPGFQGASWTSLIKRGAAFAKEREADDPTAKYLASIIEALQDQAGSLDENTLITYASGVKASLCQKNTQPYSDLMNDIFSNVSPERPDLAKLLASFNCPIATTNYDTLIESSVGWDIGPALISDAEGALQILRGESDGVVHLHGVWNDTKSIVFSKDDYVAFVGNHQSKYVRSAIYSLTSFVFVGQGNGVLDPGFTQLKDEWFQLVGESSHYHFLLCKNSDYNQYTKTLSGSTIRPIAYGEEYGDLPGFLKELKRKVDRSGRELSFEGLRGNLIAALWDEIRARSLAHQTVIDSKDDTRLVVEPSFIPKPHEQYRHERQNQLANGDVDASDAQIPLEKLVSPGSVRIVVGEDNSGLTTALQWLAIKASETEEEASPIFLDFAKYSKRNRLNKQINEAIVRGGYQSHSKEDIPPLVLAVDSVSLESGTNLNRFLEDLTSVTRRTHTFIGCRLGNERDIADRFLENKFKVQIVYLGKPGKLDVVKYADIVAPDLPPAKAGLALDIIRREHLSRNPFNLSLIIRLLAEGKQGSDRWNSPAKLVAKFIELMFSTLGEELDSRDSLDYENVELILGQLAEKMVREKSASVPHSGAMQVFEKEFEDLEWDEDASRWVDLLVEMRILAKSRNRIEFRQSTYLFYFAAKNAGKSGFKDFLYRDPLTYAPILKMLASLSRGDEEMIERSSRILDEWAKYTPDGLIYQPAKKRETLEIEEAETTTIEGGEEESLDSDRYNEAYQYDLSSDRDVEPFPLRPLGDAPESYRLFVAVDLASSVLRESDAVRDKSLKDRSLRAVLRSWGILLDLLEKDEELREGTRRKLVDASAAFTVSKDDLDELFDQFNPLYCSFMAWSGVQGSLRSKKLRSGAGRIRDSIFSGESDRALAAGLALFELTDLNRGWARRAIEATRGMQESWFFVNFVSEVAMAYFVFSDPDQDEELQVKNIIKLKILNGSPASSNAQVGQRVDQVMDRLRVRRAGRQAIIRRLERAGLL